MTTIGDFGTLSKKWDPKHLEIRTMSVEKTLEPLVLQVTTLVNTKGPSKKKKGLSNIEQREKCRCMKIGYVCNTFVLKGHVLQLFSTFMNNFHALPLLLWHFIIFLITRLCQCVRACVRQMMSMTM